VSPNSRYEQEAREAAGRFRAENGLGVAPVSDLVALIEQTMRVDVTVLPIEEDDEHGLTMVDPNRGVTIVAVPTSEHPMRWRSNLAHELAHLVFEDHQAGKAGALSRDGLVERRAQSFARHLLIPADGIRHVLARATPSLGALAQRDPLPMRVLSDLTQRFQVSPQVAAIQLRDMDLITQSTCDEWSAQTTPSVAARFGWVDQYTALQGESRQHRAPQRLLARAVAGYIAGLVSLEAVASVRGVAPEALAAEFRLAGIEPSVASTVANDDDGLPAVPASEVDLSWLDEV
jgi:Zn-dependent peptidase ImmA (M78 family)